MGAAAGFLAQFFPLFLLGALFGKLMDDSGSVQAIARFISEKLGSQRAILAVVLAGLGASSKFNAEWDFLCMLRDEGRRAAEAFLATDSGNIGKRSSIDLDILLEQV